MKNYEQENNEILKYMLEDKFFSHFQEGSYEYQRDRGLYVELYVTSVCNQKCEYCYLSKHGD